MVKKTYIIPTVITMAVAQSLPIAGSDPSLIVNTNGGAAPNEFEVKSDRGSRSDYNVWNDDWSNN